MNKPSSEHAIAKTTDNANEGDDAFAGGICKDCLNRVLTFGDANGSDEEDDADADRGGLSGDVLDKQTDGTISLFNMLAQHNVALLADEVGTGKTYQALGVISMVFARKPNARVIVIAPNASVQSGWRGKYKDFVNKKLKGSWLRDPVTESSTHPLYDCNNIREFAKEYRDNPRGLFLTRVSSLSNLRNSLDAGNTTGPKKLDPDVKPEPTPADIREHWAAKGIYFDDETIFGEAPDDEPARVRPLHEHLALCGETIEPADDGKIENTPLTTSRAINVEAARQFASVLDTFDLVVVDESHNLRNRGGNIKTNVLSTLFHLRLPGLDDPDERSKEQDARARPRLLMLTATPAQNHENDIYRQLAYRDASAVDQLENEDEDARRAYLETRMVRRLRKLADKTKYDYRVEQPRETLAGGEVSLLAGGGDNEQRLTQELMLALVQKGLAQLRQKNGDGSTELKKSVKMGYLETFESYEEPQQAKKLLDDETTHDDVKRDSRPGDTDLLEHIVQRFREDERTADDRLPPHPKLSFLEDEYEEMLRNEMPDKMLIFVRRRASVREIANRMCQTYDRVTLEQLRATYGLDAEVRTPKDFIAYVHRNLAKDYKDRLVDLSLQKDDDSIAFSKLLAPFKTGVKDETGAGFGFRTRFTRSSESLGNFFAENRLCLLYDVLKSQNTTGYNSFESFVQAALPGELPARLAELLSKDQFEMSNARRQRHYVDAAALTAILELKTCAGSFEVLAKALSAEVLDQLAGRKQFDCFLEEWQREIEAVRAQDAEDSTQDGPSLLTERHFWDVARQWATSAPRSDLSDDQLRIVEILAPANPMLTWHRTLRRRSGWKNMVSKQLRMSEGIIDLFFAYRKAASLSTSTSYKQAMIKVFSDRLLGDDRHRFRRMRHRLAQSVELFDHLVKHLQLDESEWSTHKWDKFNNQEPSVGVMGGTGGRESVIAKFNAPFFPDVVVSTSVLREGVDLHLSCRRVWHYGLPASPGILEQQTGRVDRYFARVHRALQQQKETRHDQWSDMRPNVEVQNNEGNDALEATLDVGYPYVPRSVDEMQVKRLLMRKRTIEPLLDEGISAPTTSEDLSLDDWMMMSPEDIVSPKNVQSTKTAEPFAASVKLLSGHRPCKFAERQTSAKLIQRFGDFRTALLAELDGDNTPFWLISPTSNASATPKEFLDAVRLGSPLAIVNTYVSRPKGGRVLKLSSKQYVLEGPVRHQPTLIFLRYVPHAALHILEFVTPLDADSEQTKALRGELLTNTSYRFSGCTVLEASKAHGLNHWSINLACGYPLPLDRMEDGANHHSLAATVIERLKAFVETADQLEFDVLDESDIEESDVKARIKAPTKDGEAPGKRYE